MKRLFEPFYIKHLKIKNRICVPPMVCYNWVKEDGCVVHKNIEHYRAIARGGAGLIIQEATCVDPEGKLSKDQLGIWEDRQIDGLKEIVGAVHEEGCPIFLQIHHAGVNGSGMHINMSLSRDGRNIFQDPEGKDGLSREAYYFIGGIMKHIKAITAITNPLVNSYKRLVPGYEAPVYIAWSTTNRSPLIRIPASRGDETRIELRSPDPAANPYLALAVCLRAGLEGIREKIDPPESVNCNIFSMSDEEKSLAGIERLPGTLFEAIEELEKDEFIQNSLGNHVANKYIEAKKEEWNKYCAQITDWEIDEYLYRY